jgi:hypothetical protein
LLFNDNFKAFRKPPKLCIWFIERNSYFLTLFPRYQKLKIILHIPPQHDSRVHLLIDSRLGYRNKGDPPGECSKHFFQFDLNRQLGHFIKMKNKCFIVGWLMFKHYFMINVGIWFFSLFSGEWKEYASSFANRNLDCEIDEV